MAINNFKYFAEMLILEILAYLNVYKQFEREFATLEESLIKADIKFFYATSSPSLALIPHIK